MDSQLEDFFKIRQDILNDSKDEDGYIQQQGILSRVLPAMLDSKLVDSEDCNESFFMDEPNNLKLNAYAINESGERLQLFIIDDGSIDETTPHDELNISQKKDYEVQFKRASKFVSMSSKGTLSEDLEITDSVKALVSKFSSSLGVEQFDVVEMFLISLTATVSHQGLVPRPRSIRFDEDSLNVSYEKNGEKKKKVICY